MLLADDQAVVSAQMGRQPHGLVAVAARCPVGHPAVITTYPLRWADGRLRPFPTLFWLVCPRLRRRLAELERDGGVAELEAELRDDPVLRAAVERDHATYRALRWDTLTPADRVRVEAAGLGEAFDRRGIGGMANRLSVKCLHLHLAHHLACGSALGARMVRRWGVEACPSLGPG